MKRHQLLVCGVFLFALAAYSLSVKAQAVTSPCGPGASNGPPVWVNGIGHSAWSIGLNADDCRRLVQLWDSIGEDLKRESNDLAGTYLKGGHNSGYFLRWSIKRGFIVIPYFDQNLITDYSFGKVTFVDDSKIVFTPEKQLRSGGRGFDRMPAEWTAIWRYLVPVSELKEFGDYHAGFGVYNEFNGSCCEFAPIFLAGKLDEGEHAISYPVPDKYKHFIKSPITGEILFVGKRKIVNGWGYQGKLYQQLIDKAVLIPVRISAGNLQGTRSNMLFRLVGEPDGQYLQVIKVQRSTAWGYVVRDVSDGKESYSDEHDQERPLPPIRVGMRVTTSPVRD